MSLDPRPYTLQVAPRAHLEESTFHELMAEQLRHAPWLMLSTLVHGIAVLLLMLVPAGPPPDTSKPLAMMTPPKVEEIEPEPEPQEPLEPKEPVDEPILRDELEPVDTPTDEAFVDAQPAEVMSAFEHTGWNTQLGLAGGGGGKVSGRGGGRRQLAGSRRDIAVVIERGLEWLARHQDEEGCWDVDDFMKHDAASAPRCDGVGNPVHDVGVTGLALLAFLGDGSTLRSGPYRDQVKRGVLWLKEQQDPATGLLGAGSSSHYVYDHVIATLALTEAVGLSRSRMLRPYAAKALAYLERHRNEYGVWRYQPRSNQNDTSVTGWAVLAYKSAQDFDLPVDAQALRHSARWLDDVTDPVSGRAGYMARGQASSRHDDEHAARFPREKSEAMTAVALMCRYFLGQDPAETPVMGKATETLLRTPPAWDVEAGSVDHYYWYYATYALYQAGGRAWKAWSRALTPAVVKTQRRDGNFDGSWDPVGVWGEDGGRVYSTAILVLTLEAYYRYSRVLVR